MYQKLKKITAIFCMVTSLTVTAEKKELASKDELYQGKQYKSAFANPEDTELPNVLLIGDSISIGYTVHVRKALAGKADVFRIKENGRYSAYGKEQLDKWLKGRKYDVIHFNWGQWDLCYRNPKSKNQGSRDKKNGTITATLDQYRKNLESNINKLKGTGAKLIWCHTTPVPEGEAGRFAGDAVKYNTVAAEVMSKHNIAINDLHAHAMKKYDKIKKRKGDVHYNGKGYKYLGEKVAAEITAQLSQ